MEKEISSKLTYYAVISIAIFVTWTQLYCSIGEDNWIWQALDKLNDRFFALNLLLITSFIFRSFFYRLLAYAGILFIIGYAFYEYSYIRDIGLYGISSIKPYFFVQLSLIYFVIVALIILITTYVASRNSK